MRRVLVTGAHGTIGRAIAAGLADCQLTFVDRKDGDLSDPAIWERLLPGHDAVLHLAWNQTRTSTHEVHPDNFAMMEHLFRFAASAGVQRIIYASSVHADDFYAWQPEQVLSPVVLAGRPTGAYGAAKLYGEALGRRAAAASGTEVVCLRFGGVNDRDEPPEDPLEASVWLSHEDCRRVIARALKLEMPPPHYLVAYAVSDNPERRHVRHQDLLN